VSDFAAERERLGGADITVVGISRDEPQRLAQFAHEHGGAALLLSDADRAAHAAYGVLTTREVDGQPAEKVRRSTFLIGPDKTVRRAWYDVSVDGHAVDVAGVSVKGA
jgi:peroxiredoxin Q/BCP